MKLTVPRIVAILLLVMVSTMAAWQAAERLFWGGVRVSGGLSLLYLARGVTTAIIMSSLTAYLLVRYRRRFEDLLRRQSEDAHRVRVFFETIVRDAGEAIVCLDNDGIVRSWNRAAERIYGYTAQEMVGQSYKILVPPDLRAAGEPERFDEVVKRAGFLSNLETRRLRKDGATITVRITRSLLHDTDGRVIGASAIVSDITAEKGMEARLIQAEKLAAVGQAAASMAHEVRNALAGIAGTIEVLEQTPLWRQLPEDVSEEVGVQITRIADSVNDLLTYARPPGLHLVRSDVHKILDQVIAAASRAPRTPRAPRSPHATTVQTIRRYADGPLWADVDSARLQQAFHNLLANAHQAMGPGGQLTITTQSNGAGVEICFTDTGTGMSPETLARAFEPFYTTKAKGTGLGLPIVKTIVDAHKGSIELESAPREGTTVRLRLPAAPAAVGASSAKHRSGSSAA